MDGTLTCRPEVVFKYCLYGVKDVNNISQLPAQCIDGMVLKVSNSMTLTQTITKVKFKTEGSIPGQGLD